MKISNKLTDAERHYLNNLVISGKGEVADKDGKVSVNATHQFVIDKGFIVGAIKVIRRSIDK